MSDDDTPSEDLVPVEDLTFEAASEELEKIIGRLERGDVPLEESLDAHGRGRVLLEHCRSILDRAAVRIAEVDPDESEDSPS